MSFCREEWECPDFQELTAYRYVYYIYLLICSFIYYFLSFAELVYQTCDWSQCSLKVRVART